MDTHVNTETFKMEGICVLRHFFFFWSGEGGGVKLRLNR